MHGECVINALPANNRSGTLSSSECNLGCCSKEVLWEVLVAEMLAVEVLVAEHAIEGSVLVLELLGEEEKEKEGGEGMDEDKRKGSSATSNLVPQ